VRLRRRLVVPAHLLPIIILSPEKIADPLFQARLSKIQAKRLGSLTEGPTSGHALRRSAKGGAAKKRFRPTSYP
jgi:hypothetical protein